MTLVSGPTNSIQFPIRTPNYLSDLKSQVHVAWVLKCSVDNVFIAVYGYWATYGLSKNLNCATDTQMKTSTFNVTIVTKFAVPGPNFRTRFPE